MEIVAIILLLASALYLAVARRRASADGPGEPVPRNGDTTRKLRESGPSPRHPYRATSIACDKSACEAVKAIGNRRFLDTDRNLPKLPVAGCDAGRCNCRYERHMDRRDWDEDRRNPNALQSALYDQTGKTNRRARRRGRRKTDWA